MKLRELIFLLVFYQVAGVFVTLGFLKQAELGRKYYLLHGIGIAALSGSSLFLLPHENWSPRLLLVLIPFAMISLAYSFTAGQKPKLSFLLYLLGLFTLSFFILVPPIGPEFSSAGALNATLSLLSLGFSTGALLLGHWYLTQPKLSILELRRMNHGLSLVLILRLIFCIYSIYGLLHLKSELEIWNYFLGVPGLFVLMRFLWGICLPLFLAFLITKTIQIRSTQSATGLLYVSSLCVLTGEILSQYLYLDYLLTL